MWQDLVHLCSPCITSLKMCYWSNLIELNVYFSDLYIIFHKDQNTLYIGSRLSIYLSLSDYLAFMAV